MDLHPLQKLHLPLSVLESLIIYFWYFLTLTRSYNVDTEHFIDYTGSNGTLFGYSVLLHKHENETWLIVGAPISNSTYYDSCNPGAIFKCQITNGTSCEEINFARLHDSKCGKTCHPERDNQWLGVSMSRQQTDGSILVCGHRWKNIFFINKGDENKLPLGVCYKLDAKLIPSNQYIPCYKDFEKKYSDNAACQAGMSSFLMEDLIVVGAPGSAIWTGSVFVYNTSSKIKSAFSDEDSDVQFGSYLGYSVGAGHFSHPNSTEVVGGAPQYEMVGKVCIFRIESQELNIIFQAEGNKTGSYFGAAVCVLDLNGDGLSDLLIGAPMYSMVREEGRVHVYMNAGAANMTEEFVLAGSDSYAARFGESITNLGDIDDDGYPDVAVGAPQEDDLRGAIYIYNGRRMGITQTFSQRISGLGNDFMMFGQSISGGIDVDDNSYPDIAVGAYLSDSVVVLRTRAVVVMEAFMLLPPSFNRTVSRCYANGQLQACINISVCFKVQGGRISGLIGLLYNLTADTKHLDSYPSRFYFGGNPMFTAVTGQVKVKPENLTCVSHSAAMRRIVRDIFTPITFELTYELGEHSVDKETSRNFSALKPILQQRADKSNQVFNQTKFARYCVWPNCSTNLQVSADLVLPQSYNNLSYFALGTLETIRLNVIIFNAGDDAFLPRVHLTFPRNLYFIKALDPEEKHVRCEVNERDEALVELECSVGNLYIDSMAKHNITFLLDVVQSSDAGDLNITVSGTCESFESEDLLCDNFVNLTMPLRYGVNLTTHRLVSPSAFMYGHKPLTGGFREKFNFTFKVMNVGPSKSHDSKVKISIPRYLSPHPIILLNILNVQSSVGNCSVTTSTLNVTENFFNETQYDFLYNYILYFPFSQRDKLLYCIKDDPTCSHAMCSFGDVDVGTEVTVVVVTELNPSVMLIHPGGIRTKIESMVVAFPKDDQFILDLQDKACGSVVLLALDSRLTLAERVIVLTVALLVGITTMISLLGILKKVGFFDRHEPQRCQRDSWNYVSKKKGRYTCVATK